VSGTESGIFIEMLPDTLNAFAKVTLESPEFRPNVESYKAASMVLRHQSTLAVVADLLDK